MGPTGDFGEYCSDRDRRASTIQSIPAGVAVRPRDAVRNFEANYSIRNVTQQSCETNHLPLEGLLSTVFSACRRGHRRHRRPAGKPGPEGGAGRHGDTRYVRPPRPCISATALSPACGSLGRWLAPRTTQCVWLSHVSGNGLRSSSPCAHKTLELFIKLNLKTKESSVCP